MNLNLNIKPDSNTFDLWMNHPTYENAKRNEDSGLDIPLGEDIIIPKNSRGFSINLGYEASQNFGYMLVPRSSISKTPIRLSNNVGIIDKSYRGKVMAKVDNLSETDFKFEKGKCYFQIISFNGILPTYGIIDILDETYRGNGGFGSSTETVHDKMFLVPKVTGNLPTNIMNL